MAQTQSARQTALFFAGNSFLQRPIKVTIGSDDLAAETRITQIVMEDRAREQRLGELLKILHGP